MAFCLVVMLMAALILSHWETFSLTEMFRKLIHRNKIDGRNGHYISPWKSAVCCMCRSQRIAYIYH